VQRMGDQAVVRIKDRDPGFVATGFKSEHLHRRRMLLQPTRDRLPFLCIIRVLPIS
jgi:hypothetical protein